MYSTNLSDGDDNVDGVLGNTFSVFLPLRLACDIFLPPCPTKEFTSKGLGCIK